ncbi:MAG TPA: cobalamin-dependent protein, partial [Herpetosiphonaceae bacterium]|nr:cobalamin-dependent protein [Herpetosiphonaceae bacterium]
MLRVLMLQLPVPNNPGANIPLAAGYLKAWAHERGLLERVSIEIMPRDIADRAGDALLVREIARRRPDVLGISLYTWNSERSLLIAERARRQLPGMKIVVGGPEVQRNNEWVLRHPAVDIAVEGEGEQTFAEILERLAADDGRADNLPFAALPSARDLIPLLPHTAAAPHPTALLEAAPPPIPGTIVRQDGEPLAAPARVSLSNLDVIPS